MQLYKPKKDTIVDTHFHVWCPEGLSDTEQCVFQHYVNQRVPFIDKFDRGVCSGMTKSEIIYTYYAYWTFTDGRANLPFVLVFLLKDKSYWYYEKKDQVVYNFPLPI